MASVWIARQRGKHGFEKLVALKTILPQYAADMRFQQMFLDEARIASRIEHFNVARILDLGEEHDVLYLAMEYVDGDALSKLRRAWEKKNIPAPTGVVLRVLADACSGLHEAHEMKAEDGKPLEIVHRDVSPHNILVNIKGVAKLIDFGIAKARDRLAGETNAGVLKGKIQYMAPEQALGRAVDRRADIWAVGATLYHLLTGKPAYEADNTLGTLHMLTSGRPPLPMPPNVHPAIAAIARKALTTAPDKRFATAAEMREALEAAMLDARLATTASDVSTFVLEHLGERTAKRRQLIDIALAAAAERERVEEILRPAMDRTGSGVTSSSGARPLASGAPAITETLGGLRTDAPVEPPPSSTDLALPGSRKAALVVSFVVGGALVAGGVAFATMRTQPKPLPSTTAAAAPGGSVAAAKQALAMSATTATAAVASVTPDPSTVASTTGGAIPVFEADSLPKAGAAAAQPASAPVRVGAPVARPVPAAATAPATRRKKPVDDGF